jgi:hypothetical protein
VREVFCGNVGALRISARAFIVLATMQTISVSIGSKSDSLRQAAFRDLAAPGAGVVPQAAGFGR